MGVGLLPLEFTDCLTDSPYFRDNLHAHEKELDKTSQQIKRLIKEVKDLLTAAKHLSRAQRTLSSSLKNFSFECIGSTQTDDELVITRSLAEFGKLIALIEDERDRMLNRAYDQIILPLENFRKEHIGGVKEGKKKFEKQTAKFCQSQERYLNLSTKKQDNILQEADASLEMEQRHFSQASLEYVFLLQEVQERKKFEFVEILLSFMFGWLTFYHEGHEVAEDFKPYMRELQLRIQKTRENFISTRDKTESLMKKLLEMRQTKPVVDSSSSTPGISREGYLYLMEKKTLGTTWTKHYCMYQRDTKQFTMIPYNQMTGKFNTSEKMTLASCVRRMSDSIEKRFCFDLTPVDRPGVVYTLQALSEEDRKAWMDVMDGKEPTYGMPATAKVPKPEERSLDETGFMFVTKCIEVIEARGLEEQGLYRVVGVSSKVTKLLAMGLDRRKLEKLSLEDPFEWESKTITSALKTYLRNLPEPLMTFRYHNAFITAAKQEKRTDRINAVHALTHRIPQPNLNMLDILIKHLTNVAAHSDKNLMPVSNLGVCFGPTLLRPEEETVAAIMDIKFCNVVVEILIENYQKIFKTQPEQSIVDPLPDSRGSSPQRPPRQSTTVPSHQIRQNKFQPPLTHAITKSYYDGPLLSASLHNVASASRENLNRERSDSYTGTQSSSGLPSYVSSTYGQIRNSELSRTSESTRNSDIKNPNAELSKNSELMRNSELSRNSELRGNMELSRPISVPASGSSTTGRMSVSSNNSTAPAFPESNYHTIGSYSSSPHQPKPTHPSQQSSYFYSNVVNSDQLNSTSSSNDSMSSLSSRDINNHSSTYATVTPQKNSRGIAKMGIHYATRYRPQDNMNLSCHSVLRVRSNQQEFNSGIRKVRTLFACLGENDGELSFEPNQIITNVRTSFEPGWLEGTLNGKTGLIPENYVEVLP
ncbi:rho GTPase-activating protein 26 isoform X2 [Bemisia tabaci]|uniref:rho GTPase-activating protein 26 isoform X2 n=1 Tax=Bemisia tabaci TaxID=7038 RepID=UPI003B28D435